MLKERSNEKIFKFFPFLEWLHILREKVILRRDIIAWITVALVVIPQSMAYASLAWLPLQVWLYTAFIPLMVWALFWSSRQMSTGPVTIISLMTATALSPMASANQEVYVAYASILALFIWVFYLILWSLRLWVVVDFLSHPVIIGFTNAVAIITITSQISKIFWVHPDKWSNYFEWIYYTLIEIFVNTHSLTLLFWAWAIIVLLLFRKYFPKFPRVLLVLFLSIIASRLVWYESIWWSIIWYIPDWLPSFSFPFFEVNIFSLWFEWILNLAFFAIIIWLIWFTESISVAKYVWTQTKQRVSANRELFWQWLANISSGLFSWYWVAWSFSKTAVNLRAWAKTWFAWVITWVIVAITLLYFTPLLFSLPDATLAAIIIVAVANLIKIRPIIKSWKIEIHDWIVAILTFAFTLILAPEIESAIIIWVLVSITFFIYRSMKPRLVEVCMYKDWNLRDAKLFKLKRSKEVSVYRFDWVLYFANAWYFENRILDLASEKNKLKFVIIDLEWVSDIDASSIEVLKNVVHHLEAINIKVLISSVRVKVAEKFINSWFIDKFWKENFFINIKKSINFLEEKYWGDLDLRSLLKYRPKGKKSEWRQILKKI